MPLSPEVKKVIELIDQRISSLGNIRTMLIREFGGEGETTPLAPTTEGVTLSVAPTTAAPTTAPPPGTRRASLIEFLRTKGPHSRKEIVESTQIPIGTVSYLLNDQNTFEQIDGNKWRVRGTSGTIE